MCAASVERVAGRLEGVISVKADYIQGTAVVTYDPAQVTPEQVVETINTNTFYRASLPLPGTAESPPRQSRRWGWLPYLVVSVGTSLLALVWYRRRRSRPIQHTEKEKMEEHSDG